LKRNAFTLIELLVVIAIIAILAAILFPVFAQAKDAAKTTAAISNVKQTALGILMYTNDVDDCFPLDWDSDQIQSGYWTWQTRIMPYVKSWPVMLNPKIPAPTGPYAYWQRLLHLGMMPTAAAVPGAAQTGGHFAYTGGFYAPSGVTALVDGIGGMSIQTGGAYGGYGNSTEVSSPSLTTTSLGAPSDYAMITPAGAWDDFVGAIGQDPFVYCVTFGAASITPNQYAFEGPVNVTPSSGPLSGLDGCYYPSGRSLMAGVDGHAKTMDNQGQLLQTKPLNDGSGNYAFTHYYTAGVQ